MICPVSDHPELAYRLSFGPQRSSCSLRSRWSTRAGESRSAGNTRSALQDARSNEISEQSNVKLTEESELPTTAGGLTADPLAPGIPSVPGLPCTDPETPLSYKEPGQF